MDRIWPAALALLATAGCMPAPSAAAFGPQPAPCTDSITARVARLPTESVTVADREHALWAQAQCRAALDSVGRAALQAPASPGTSSPRTDAAGATAAGGT